MYCPETSITFLGVVSIAFSDIMMTFPPLSEMPFANIDPSSFMLSLEITLIFSKRSIGVNISTGVILLPLTITFPDGDREVIELDTSIFPAPRTEFVVGLLLHLYLLVLLTVFAMILPVEPILTVFRVRLLAVAAESFIIPPFALSVPEFETILLSVFPLISLTALS